MDFFDYVKSNKFVILIISIIMNFILAFLSIYLIINNKCDIVEYNPIIDKKANNNQAEVLDDFYVEVKGAVKKPGVYKLNSNNIINDLINTAGGFTKNAYTKNINLSKSLAKELVVYVYTSSEYKKLQEDKIVYITKEIVKELPCECSTYDISNCIENAKSEIVASNKDSNYVVEQKKNDDTTNYKTSLININTATVEELQTLSGIGASKAKAIVEYRTKNGLFKETQEITNVSGISTSLYEKIKDNITI